MSPRAAPPRRLGLVDAAERGLGRSARGPYPYAIGDRVAGDLTVIGHLATGRLCHLYQVWSAHEWCAFTCKILSPDRRDRAIDRRALRREGRILRAVRHPNLVQSYGEGEHEGLPFLLMEYLEGPSFFDVIEDQPDRRLSACDALRTAIHLGAAVYHLHRRGFLHLDLKPANLILRDHVPVLIDLDSARRIRPGRRGNGIGTGPYMAPELVRRQEVSPATDVYGLGALLYEMLTGRWPYEAVYQEEEPRRGLERQFPQIGIQPPDPPSRFAPDLTDGIDRTVLRCLAADPAERFDNLHPLLLALSEELERTDSLWPSGVRAERRQHPREPHRLPE